MVRPYRKTSAPGGPWYEFYGTVCPICGHTGMCMIHEDGNRLICCRVASDIEWAKNSALPGWLHFLKGKKVQFNLEDIDTTEDNPKKADGELNRTYQALISELKMTKEHLLHLVGPTRQLTPNQILFRKYRSFPEQPWKVAKKVISRLGKPDDLIGVPGFYMKDGKHGKYMMIKGNKNSFLIPFRNERNQIVGFQYRVDKVHNKAITKQKDDKFSAFIKKQPNHVLVTYEGEIIFEGKIPINSNWKNIEYEGELVGSVKIKKGNRYMWLSSANEEGGTGAGPLPVHVSIPSDQLRNWKTGTLLQKDTVWLTEGPLKADIASDLLPILFKEDEMDSLGDTVLSIPGVNSWRIILPILEKMGVKRVIYAFDMDAIVNEDVKRNILESVQELKDRDYTIDVAMWDQSEGKGIDDILLKEIVPEVKRVYPPKV
ncbi:DUF3854 domain-containing protein [Virgibacillus halodenitrificans]|uniref:DUF3854 domain-containing protein n=1 Tax=Virgibacillus halodenitrificans TaxID=1482 RepID=UPI000EF542C2|nr:DUF3854 domain-containing protein [Virgibacillus halodenitrificans]